MLVLMREDLAQRDGRCRSWPRCWATALSADGYHPTAPHPEGEGAARAIRAALAPRASTPDEVNYVNSHGTGTRQERPGRDRGDQGRAGRAPPRHVAVSSTKSMIGHLLGAAGAVEDIVTVEGARGPDRAADRQLHRARPRVRPRLRAQHGPAAGDRRRDLQQLRLRRRERRRRVGPAGRAPGAADAGLRPGGGHRARRAHERGHRRRGSSGRRSPRDARLRRDENGVPVGRVELDLALPEAQGAPAHGPARAVLASIAAQLALEDAGLEIDRRQPRRASASIVGTGVGPDGEHGEVLACRSSRRARAAANPAVVPEHRLQRRRAGRWRCKLGAVGPASTVTAGHAAGASALCYALRPRAAGQADAVIASPPTR